MYHGRRTEKNVNPKKNANFLSLITFFFTFDLLRKGYKKDLTEDDVYQVLPQFKSSLVGDKLEKQWLKEAMRASKASIYRLLWNCYGQYYLLLGIVQLSMKIIMIIVLPRLQGKLISYFTPSSKLTKANAVYYAALLIILNIVQTTYNHNYRFLITELGIKMKAAFCSLIYRKSLKLSAKSLSENGIGKIVTLISKDVNSFENAIVFWNDMWISLIVFVVACCILYSKIGAAALVGISLLILIIPLQVCLGKLTSYLRIKAAETTDKRLQLSQEILSTMKIIKMYTWEKFFGDKILKLRKEEMRWIKQYYFARATFTEIGSLIITFIWYILITTYTSLGHNLTAEIAFFLRECLRALRSPITISLPLGILRSSELVASVRRFHQVLRGEEQLEVDKSNIKSSTICIQLENVAVAQNDKLILENVDLKINAGVNLITGKVGSGKSSLLKTILQEYPICEGKLSIEGKISYAPQDPWLFPSTLKRNIIFGQQFEQDRYTKVLQICALETDIEGFRKGDETLVDDGGRNLSKGQQVRIGLARALYCDSDIYLLDDCLSSLDINLQKFVFEESIKKFLKDKVVVMVSNDTKLFKKVDNVIVLENGTIKSCLKSSEILEDAVVGVYDNTIDDVLDAEGRINELTCMENEIYENIYHEKPKKGKVVLSVYKKYFKYGGGVLILIWIILLYVATQTGLSYSEKWVSKWVNTQQQMFDYKLNLTNSTSYTKLTEQNIQVLNLYTFAIVSSIVFLCLRIFTYFSFVAKASIALHNSMFLSVLKATMHFFDLRYFGNILNRFAKDMYNIDELLPFNIDECLKFFFILASSVILILSVGFDFLIQIFVLFVILFFIRRFYISTGRSLQRLDSALRSPVVGHLSTTLEGLSTIRAYEMQGTLKEEFDQHLDLYTSTFYMEQSASRAFAYSLDLLCNVFIAAIIIRFLVTEKETQAGNVGLAITQALSLPGRFQWGIKQWAELENHMTSVERVLEYTNVQGEKKGGETEGLDFFGKITYEDVSLSYKNTKGYVLNDINFTINAGEKIGIVGRTGAGKSSLISILFRLYQYKGIVSIDDVNIETMPLDLLRSNIFIISQDPFVFSGTVRSNIDPTGLYQDEEIWEGIRKVKLEKLITNLDEQIDDNGSKFSLGQKQLICLVRALISKSKIIVLDEATAHVDPETDFAISKIIEENFAGCTVITITHKIYNILHYDKVMVIDSGKIVEFDSPEVLMEEENGFFHRMVVEADLLQKIEKKCT